MEDDNDKDVEVTFELVGKDQVKFTFKPDELTMKKKGKVKFHRSPEDAEWTFKDGDVKDDKLNQFRSTLAEQGKKLHMHNDMKDTVRTRYRYYIRVELKGTVHRSPDPVIVNDPGGIVP